MYQDRFIKDPIMRNVYTTIVVNDDLEETKDLMRKLVQAFYFEEFAVEKKSELKPNVIKTTNKEEVKVVIESSCLMKQAINTIVDANKDTDVKKGLETLWRMTRNIIRDPNEPKFRILKKTNKWVLLLLAL